MATITPFVTPKWLTEQLYNVVVLDVRYALDGSITKQDYLAGHIPTAIYANFPSLAGGDAAPDKGRSPLPDPAKFAADLGALGVGDDTTVIVYDQGGSGAASRIVYMLRSLGDNAAVLDGGLAAWNGPLDTSDVTPVKTTRNAKPWPTERFIDADELTHLMDTSNTVLFDARPEDRYAGLNETVDARPGHIGAGWFADDHIAQQFFKLADPCLHAALLVFRRMIFGVFAQVTVRPGNLNFM
jgi:thiosulfate/3-mercaptopyruvate sulfurtransferase